MAEFIFTGCGAVLLALVPLSFILAIIWCVARARHDSASGTIYDDDRASGL
jgi:hypothetical protein